MVSRRGRRDRRHRGHKNLRSLAACMAANCEDLFFKFADLGNGTQVPEEKKYYHIKHHINLLRAGLFLHACGLLDFFKINFYKKISSGIPLEGQTVWILTRPDILSGLIWDQTD